MNEPDFELIDACIAEIQANLTAMSADERAEGVARLRTIFDRSEIVLSSSDNDMLDSWVEKHVSTVDLISCIGPKVDETMRKRERN